MKKPVIALLCVALVAGLWAAYGRTQDPQQRPNKVGPFMQAKLSHSQNVLAGLALEDYGKIEKSAQDLSLLSRESNWRVLQTPKYLQLSADFRRATDRLATAAQEKNVDAATLAYVELTLNCVHCHKYVRDVRHTKIDYNNYDKITQVLEKESR